MIKGGYKMTFGNVFLHTVNFTKRYIYHLHDLDAI